LGIKIPPEGRPDHENQAGETIELKEGRTQKMDIWLMNDDGLDAPGLRVLADALTAMGHQVSVWAPDQNWSGSGHYVTVRMPIGVRSASGWEPARAHRVYGSPADCFRVAHALSSRRPDLVMTGINDGWNLGRDVHRSGTVAAAREAVLSGVPAVAWSAYDREVTSDAVMVHADYLIRLALRYPSHVVNVNLPRTTCGTRRLTRPDWTAVTERAEIEAPDAHGLTLVRMARRMASGAEGTATDVAAVAAGHVAISLLPVHDADLNPAVFAEMPPNLSHTR